MRDIIEQFNHHEQQILGLDKERRHSLRVMTGTKCNNCGTILSQSESKCSGCEIVTIIPNRKISDEEANV